MDFSLGETAQWWGSSVQLGEWLLKVCRGQGTDAVVKDQE